MRRPATLPYLVSAAIVALGLAAFHVLPIHPVINFAIVFIGASAAYIWMCREIIRTPITGTLLWIMLGLGMLLRLSFFAADPVGSDDVYRYLWDGKVQAAGINPYRHTPDDPSLASLHSTLLPKAVNHPDMQTVYFPFSQWLFLLAYLMAGEALWGLKAMLLAAETATVIALLMALSRAGQPRRLVLLYALCPLPILAFALDAHVDGFGLPLLVFGLLLTLRGRTVVGPILLGLSMSVKPVALVILPVLLVQSRDPGNRIRIALIPLATALLPFLPYAIDVNPFEAISTFAAHWLFNGSIFELVNAFVQDNQRARIISGIALAVALLALPFTRHDVMRKAAFSILLLLLFSPVVHPWYVTWVAVLLPVVPLRSVMAFAATVSLTAFTLVGYRLSGVWEQHPAVLILEYAPVIVLFVLEMAGRLRIRIQAD
jgi:hypothetical protein